MPIDLRLARWSDVAALNELIPLSARGLRGAYYRPAQVEGALGTVFGVDTQLIRDETYYVAELDGELVGCGGWSRRKTLFGADRGKKEEDALLDPSVDSARIRAFFIHPDHARRGIGTAIMTASESAAIVAGFKRIEIVATLPGEPLYARFGYIELRRYELDLPNGEKMPVVHMGKTITRPPDC